MIKLAIYLRSPLSHGDPALNTDEGNFRSLRKQHVLGVGEVPILSGNAIRGVMRRRAMRHFLDLAGMGPETYKDQRGAWDRIYAALANGGTLNGSEKAVQTTRLRELRAACPPLSLLGSALYTYMLPGMMSVLDAYPRCAEVAAAGLSEPSEVPLADVYGDRHHVRLIDAEVDKDAVGITPMPYTHEVLYPGTILDGGILLDPATTEIERDCCAWMIGQIDQLGGNLGKGMGHVQVDVSGQTGNADRYVSWATEHAPAARQVIESAITAKAAAA